MTNILAAINYFPFAGLQILTSLASQLTKDNFAKFCGIQSIIYYIFVAALFIFGLPLLAMFSDVWSGMYLVPGTLFMILVVFIPFNLVLKAYHETPVYFPIIGKPIAKLVKYRGDRDERIQNNH